MQKLEATRFGKFFLLNKIAQGGMAEIFVAYDCTDPKSPQKVAIKKLLSKFSTDKRFVTMLIDEAKITSLLEHPNIVKIFDVGTVGTDFFISFEYVHGKSLEKILARLKETKTQLPVASIGYISFEIAKALAFAHTFKDMGGRLLNLVHRDVTPGNILISYSGEVKLADFGIATASRDLPTSKSEPAFGKKAYMPPEQLKNLKMDSRVDIYSFACVIYEMLTARKVFDAPNDHELARIILEENPKPPSAFSTEAAPFDPFLLKALEKDPDKRYGDVIRFFRDIEEHFPPSDKEGGTLSKLLLTLFKNEKSSEEILTEEAVSSINLTSLQAEPQKPQSMAEPGDAQEKTEFIAKDMDEVQTSFLPKKEQSGQSPASEIPPAKSEPGPFIRIKTKKVTPQELAELKKPVPDEPDEINTSAFPISEVAPDDKAEESDSAPAPIELPSGSTEQSDFENAKTGERKEEKESEPKPEDEAKSLFGEDDLARRLETEKARAARLGTEIAKKSKIQPIKLIAPFVVTLIALALAYLAVRIFLTPGRTPGEHLVLNEFNPQKISVIIFANKPDQESEKIFQKVFSSKLDGKYDNISSLRQFFRSEYARYRGKDPDFLTLSFVGPIIIGDSPPAKTTLFDKSNIAKFFEQKMAEKKMNTEDSTIKVFTFFYAKRPEDPPSYPIIYRDWLPPRTQIVFLPLSKEEINSSMIILANRILALFGATEKLDSNGVPIYPGGYAEPDLNPVYPQRFAEIMARYIPESASGMKVAESLSKVRIGQKTASEIGWTIVGKKD